jgi:hypothetical protein
MLAVEPTNLLLPRPLSRLAPSQLFGAPLVTSSRTALQHMSWLQGIKLEQYPNPQVFCLGFVASPCRHIIVASIPGFRALCLGTSLCVSAPDPVGEGRSSGKHYWISSVMLDLTANRRLDSIQKQLLPAPCSSINRTQRSIACGPLPHTLL